MAEENLLPKAGEQTSSFKVATLSALAPVALGLVLIIGAAFTPYPEVRDELLGLLKYLVGIGILGGAGIGMQYVSQRGKVSVAKLDAYKAINAAPQTTQAAGTQINVTQPEGAK